MKLFGFFKEKPVPFSQFRDMVRQVIRRNKPFAKMQPTDVGFILTIDDQPISCNLQNLYAAYTKSPQNREALIQSWLDTLITEVPEQTWFEAQMSLRPMLKTAGYVSHARALMAKNKVDDELPAQSFIGDLSVIVVREISNTLTAVTQTQLDKWGMDFERVVKESLNNMSMMSFPPISNEFRLGGSGKGKGMQEGDPIGFAFEGDHLTATWLLSERFRDHLSMRLQSDFVVAVPHRARLVAVRADEPGLVASVIQMARTTKNTPYMLTSQCYHVSVSTTGGLVSVFTPDKRGEVLGDNSLFATRRGGTPLQSPTGQDPIGNSQPHIPMPGYTQQPTGGSIQRANTPLVDFAMWGGGDDGDGGATEITPWSRGKQE